MASWKNSLKEFVIGLQLIYTDDTMLYTTTPSVALKVLNICILFLVLYWFSQQNLRQEGFSEIVFAMLLEIKKSIFVLQAICLAANMLPVWQGGMRYESVPSLLLHQVYADYESDPLLRQGIEFCCRQFYILHRKPFILQLFASVAPLLEFTVRWPRKYCLHTFCFYIPGCK